MLAIGEWISLVGLATIIVLQLLKWASDKGEARAMRAAMKEQIDELNSQITKLWVESDAHSRDIAYFKGRFGQEGRFSRVLDTEPKG